MQGRQHRNFGHSSAVQELRPLTLTRDHVYVDMYHGLPQVDQGGSVEHLVAELGRIVEGVRRPLVARLSLNLVSVKCSSLQDLKDVLIRLTPDRCCRAPWYASRWHR